MLTVVGLFLFGFIALSAAIWFDVHERNLASTIAALIGAGLILAGVTFTPAHAHDHNRTALDGWYKGLTSGKGPCCDGSDANHVADVDWRPKGNSYEVRIDGQWVDVPPEAVLPGPNLDGRTLVWPTWADGHRAVRCFLPGPMT